MDFSVKIHKHKKEGASLHQQFIAPFFCSKTSYGKPAGVYEDEAWLLPVQNGVDLLNQ